MTHTAGSVTTQSIVQICDGFCSIQTTDLKQVMAGLPYIKIYFL
jgi:hypothetical protein